MKKLILFSLLSAGFTLLAETEAPTLIPFQGRLTDQNGVAYSNAQYSITFNIYDVPAGGDAKWSERHEKVGIINGMINVFLGSITPLPGKVNFSNTMYLGITIDSDGTNNTPDPEMVPRQLIVTPFYAKNSDKLRGADWSAIMVAGEADNPMTGHVNGAKLADKSVTKEKLADNVFEKGFEMPAGVIMPFAGKIDQIPAGWHLCNGQTMAQSDHKRLFDAIGHTWSTATCDRSKNFNLPDFSNRTLWGVNGKQGEQAVGTYLSAALPNVMFNDQYFTVSFNNPVGFLMPGGGTPLPVGYSKSTYSASTSSSVYKDGCNTVQPPAGCVYFIIKD